MEPPSSSNNCILQFSVNSVTFSVITIYSNINYGLYYYNQHISDLMYYLTDFVVMFDCILFQVFLMCVLKSNR